MAEKKQNFEQSLARLNEIVTALERGDAPLAESLKLFEEGAGLITSCQKQLDAAEQRVVKLRKGADGEPEEIPFDEVEK
ncbi:MAG: exodeoxyribonuclease VII small subunit [Oscillospiraceae bacterium]